MIPYEFTGPYADCYRNPDNSIDVRHVYLVHDVLVVGRFAAALEIGAADGACTTAFVESLKQTGGRVYTCDLQVPQTLLSVCDAVCDEARFRVFNIDAVELLKTDMPFDFILVDGYHDRQSVEPQWEQIKRRLPTCIMAHDVCADDCGYRNADGAKWLREQIESHPEYRGRVLLDAERREGEATERGMLFATRSGELFRAVRPLFEKWGAWERQGVPA